jgi:hypothetical protein
MPGPMFHLFPDLPTEIRLQIWEYAFSVHCVVTISPERRLRKRSVNLTIISRACKEARYIYETKLQTLKLGGSEKPYARFRLLFPLTTFYLHYHREHRVQQLLSKSPHRDQIQHIATTWYPLRDLIRYKGASKTTLLDTFPQLQTFTVLLSPGNPKDASKFNDLANVCGFIKALRHYVEQDVAEQKDARCDLERLKTSLEKEVFNKPQDLAISRKPPRLSLIVSSFIPCHSRESKYV